MTLLRLMVSLCGRESACKSTLLAMVRASGWRHHRIAGTSLELKLPNSHGNMGCGQGNDLGYGKNA